MKFKILLPSAVAAATLFNAACDTDPESPQEAAPSSVAVTESVDEIEQANGDNSNGKDTLYVIGDSTSQGLFWFSDIELQLTEAGWDEVYFEGACSRPIGNDSGVFNSHCDENPGEKFTGNSQIHQRKDTRVIRRADGFLAILGANDTGRSIEGIGGDVRTMHEHISEVNPDLLNNTFWVEVYFNPEADKLGKTYKVNAAIANTFGPDSIIKLSDIEGVEGQYCMESACGDGTHPRPEQGSYDFMASAIMNAIGSPP